MTRPRGLLSPLFLFAAIVLAAAAVGLRPAIGALGRYYSKLPIELRKKVDAFDTTGLPSFRLLTDDLVLGLAAGDVETPDVASFVFGPRQRVGRVRPDEQTMLFITYYSDPRERISHTPEVCYRQGGAVIRAIRTVTVETPGLGPRHPRIDARLLDIDHAGRRTVLVYSMISNGRFFHDREAVRFAIGWPGDGYVYYSKVEAVTPCPSDAAFDEAVARCKRLLAEALPVLVNQHYPTDAQLQRRRPSPPAPGAG